MAATKRVAPTSASPAELVQLLNDQATKSTRLALTCLRRWEALEEEGSSSGVDNVKKICEAGGAAAAVAVMAAHASKDAAIAERGCRAIATIAHGSLEEKETVIASGGVGAVSDAMNAQAHAHSVQVQGLVALANLAAGDDRSRAALNEGGAPAVATRAILRHKGELTLQEQAMRFYANLTSSAAGAEAVVSCGGVSATVLAMAAHWSEPGLMWLGSRVLANVAESAPGVLVVCEAGGGAAVVCALEVHSAEAEVQAEGCRALCNLAFAAVRTPAPPSPSCSMRSLLSSLP